MTEIPDDFILRDVDDDRDREIVPATPSHPPRQAAVPAQAASRDPLNEFPVAIAGSQANGSSSASETTPVEAPEPRLLAALDFQTFDAAADRLSVSDPPSVPRLEPLSDPLADPMPPAPDGQGDQVIGARASRRLMWTGVAALVVGLVGGFAGGYAARGARTSPLDDGRTPVAAVAARTPLPETGPGQASGQASGKVSGKASGKVAAPVPTVREFTEDAIKESERVVPQNTSRAPDSTRPDADPGTSREARPADSSTSAGRLLVRSTPADAQVFVDGREEGRTPATIRGLARGAHRVRIVLEGFDSEESPIVITAERPAQSISVDLERTQSPAAAAVRTSPSQPLAGDDTLVGKLDVESRPPGAQVFVDGTLVGTTPFTSTRIGAGRHAIGLERDGYRRWLSNVWIAGGEHHRITASLER